MKIIKSLNLFCLRHFKTIIIAGNQWQNRKKEHLDDFFANLFLGYYKFKQKFKTLHVPKTCTS